MHNDGDHHSASPCAGELAELISGAKAQLQVILFGPPNEEAFLITNQMWQMLDAIPMHRLIETLQRHPLPNDKNISRDALEKWALDLEVQSHHPANAAATAAATDKAAWQAMVRNAFYAVDWFLSVDTQQQCLAVLASLAAHMTPR